MAYTATTTMTNMSSAVVDTATTSLASSRKDTVAALTIINASTSRASALQFSRRRSGLALHHPASGTSSKGTNASRSNHTSNTSPNQPFREPSNPNLLLPSNTHPCSSLRSEARTCISELSSSDNDTSIGYDGESFTTTSTLGTRDRDGAALLHDNRFWHTNTQYSPMIMMPTREPSNPSLQQLLPSSSLHSMGSNSLGSTSTWATIHSKSKQHEPKSNKQCLIVLQEVQEEATAQDSENIPGSDNNGSNRSRSKSHSNSRKPLRLASLRSIHIDDMGVSEEDDDICSVEEEEEVEEAEEQDPSRHHHHDDITLEVPLLGPATSKAPSVMEGALPSIFELKQPVLQANSSSEVETLKKSLLELGQRIQAIESAQQGQQHVPNDEMANIQSSFQDLVQQLGDTTKSSSMEATDHNRNRRISSSYSEKNKSRSQGKSSSSRTTKATNAHTSKSKKKRSSIKCHNTSLSRSSRSLMAGSERKRASSLGPTAKMSSVSASTRMDGSTRSTTRQSRRSCKSTSSTESSESTSCQKKHKHRRSKSASGIRSSVSDNNCPTPVSTSRRRSRSSSRLAVLYTPTCGNPQDEQTSDSIAMATASNADLTKQQRRLNRRRRTRNTSFKEQQPIEDDGKTEESDRPHLLTSQSHSQLKSSISGLQQDSSDSSNGMANKDCQKKNAPRRSKSKNGLRTTGGNKSGSKLLSRGGKSCSSHSSATAKNSTLSRKPVKKRGVE